MKGTADTNVEIKFGALPRPVPPALAEFTRLLHTPGASVTRVQELVTELEADYRAVPNHLGAIPGLDAESMSTMKDIMQALKNPQLQVLGITSQLVQEQDQAVLHVHVAGYHR